MIEATPRSEQTLSDKEYIAYKSAVRDFALSAVFATNVLYGNPLKAITGRPFEVLKIKDIDGQLALKETETMLTDGFFKYESLFHSLLGNHDTARTWAQHINWPFTRFNTLIAVAHSERNAGKDTKESAQSAKDSLDQVPVIVSSLKPKLAMAWVHIAPFAQDIGKQSTVCIDTAKFILGSLHQELTAFLEDDMQYQNEKINSLATSIVRAYLTVAQAEGQHGLGFQMSLRLAQEFGQKVFDTERSIELLLRSALTKKTFGVEFTDDINKAKGIVMNIQDREYKHEALLSYLLTIAETELTALSNPDQTLELGRELSVTHSNPKESFWGLIQIAQFEKRKGLDATHTLNLARQAKERFDRSEWGYLEKAIAQAEQMGVEDNSIPEEDYFEIVGRIRESLAVAKIPREKYLYARGLVTIQVENGFYSSTSFQEAEALTSSLGTPLQAECLLDLAKLAAKAGMNPRYYTDKVRHLVYQKMIKGYRTDDVFQKITETEVEIARTLINRCYPTLKRLGRTEMEQLTREATRLNDKDCLIALGAFLPLAIQDKFVSQETADLFLAGRAMRRIW